MLKSVFIVGFTRFLLPMTELFGMDCSLCQCTLYADSSLGSSERTCQTTVGAILLDLHASVATYFC